MAWLTLKPLVSRLRYASQVIQIRSQYLCPGNYWPHHGYSTQYHYSIIAYSDELYLQKYVKFVGTRFHELEHESMMRLLKTHSHTFEQRGYEAEAFWHLGRYVVGFPGSR